MKILYISCHQVLEYDEVKMLHELGYDVFSAGTYSYPKYRNGMIRPGIDTLPHYEELERYANTIVSNGYAIPHELIEWADTIIFMHLPEAVEKNWQRIKHKRVIFRSIGQCMPHQERILSLMHLEGLQIVRYSPKERNLNDYAGHEAVIRFYKDPDEFTGYTGSEDILINLSQSLKQRAEFCHYNAIKKITSDYNARVYGVGNEDLGTLSGGELSYQDMKERLRTARAYVYTGTWPASYTLGLMEAMMTGTPIVAIGKVMAQNEPHYSYDFYEVEDFIQDSINGFVSNNLEYLHKVVGELLQDRERALQIGAKGREKAIELFGKDAIYNQWKGFLGC